LRFWPGNRSDAGKPTYIVSANASGRQPPLAKAMRQPKVGISQAACVFALAGGVSGLSIADSKQLLLATGGGVLVFIGVALYAWEARQQHARQSESAPNMLKCKAEIHVPDPNALVGTHVDASGTVSRAPAGYVWRVLRGYPRAGGVIPYGRMDIEDATGKWRVFNFEVGGEAGRNDRRSLEIWLVGKDGEALLECWENGHLVHRKAMEKIKSLTGSYGEWLEPIKKTTKDMVRCAKVDLIRK
jgi:hypothetical protein